MRLMTFNIWNYTPPWVERRRLLADIILAHNPDVVALQEARHDFRFDHGRSQGEQLAALTDRHAVGAIAQVYWPVPRVDERLVILTRQEPDDIAVVRLSRARHERADENNRVLLAVAVREGEGRVWVADTHFSLGSEARRTNARDVAAFADSHPGPIAVMGDLNAEPESEPMGILRAAGLADAWEVGGHGPGFTYASSRPVRRIDYLLVRDLVVDWISIAGQEAAGGVYPSDHLGLVADVHVAT